MQNHPENAETFNLAVDDRYVKSNFLIGAKYKSSLLENKLLAIALSRVQNYSHEDEDNNLVCELPASELKKMLGITGGSFYQRLDEVADQMSSRTIGMSNPESKEFIYIPLLGKCAYKNGILAIKFNSELRPYLTEIEKNFAVLELNTMLSFRSTYSFRIYEYLLSKCFHRKGDRYTGNHYRLEVGLSEFKLTIGIINAELDSVKRELRGKKNPDYDKAAAKSIEKTFEKWAELKRAVLDPALEEINASTTLHVEYTPVKAGRGARVIGIIFDMVRGGTQAQEDEKEAASVVIPEKELTEDERFELFLQLRSQIKTAVPLTYSDLDAIAKAGNYDLGRIVDAYDLMCRSSSKITNVVGWMISALKGRYTENEAVTGKAAAGTRFSNFKQRDYDYDDLEAQLLRSQES